MKSSYGIAVFHNIGDILLCTPIARQLKADNPDCEVIWHTSEKYKFILGNNPFIDQVVSFDGDPLVLDKSIQELKSRRQWTQFFTPAAYMNYDKMVDGSLPELVRSSVDFEWTVPFVPVLRLSETEKARAAAYWNGLPSGRKILIETEFDSQQSPLTEEYIDKLFEIFSSISPVFVFTAKNKPAYFDKFKNKYSNMFWCQEEFRLNAEFYNLCDAFIGVSSGISCLSNSDYCRDDVPHLEISRGYHWSNAPYSSRKKELYVSYSLARYVDGLHWLLNKLTNSTAEHCFSPRFISGSHVYGTKEIVPCSLCGAAGHTAVRGQDIVRCNECGNIYLRARMTKSSMEKYYSEVYAVNQPAAAAPVRVPRSKEQIDLLPEFIGAQRREVLAEIQSLLKVDLAGKVLIDIGCGWGAFLHHARNQGMKVMGFEFTRPNVEFGRNVLNIDIRRQQFIDADDIQENSVDIIVMNHSLEHVPYPFEFLEKIEYVLKPGGIFFGMVPNFESICSSALLDKWAWIEPDWHYTHFTPKTLKETLAQTGFYIEKLYTTSGDYGDDIPISILKKIKPGLYEPNYREHLKTFQKHGRGEQINVIAVKRGSSKGRVIHPKKILTPVPQLAAVEIDSVKHIIWLRTDSIGDAVLSSSMLPPLRKKYPAASITVVCQEHVAELYEACNAVNRIVTIPTEHRWKDQRHYDEFLNTIRALNPDLLINSVYSVHGLSDLKGLEFIPERIAIRQSPQATYTRLIPISSEIKSELQRHLAFLHGLGIVCESLEPSAWITQADIDYADAVFREHGLDSKNTIAFFAGTRTDNRTYEGYADALRPIVEQRGCSVIALGGAAEHAINQVQLDALKTKTVNLCGQITLRQSAAILSRCRMTFGAETGLAHIAAAVGIPHVILIGGGHFGRFMPYSPLTSLVCLPLNCYGCDWTCRYKQVRCIRGVQPYVITRALEDCMSGSSDKTRIYLQNRVPSEYDNHLLASEAIGTFADPGKVSLIYVRDSQECRDAHIQCGSCDVSIVLATKDRAELLDNMLSSLKAAVGGISYEIIVIEGGSSDNTLDVLRKHSITRIYNEKECLGPGRHSWPQLYNFGFSKARGKWAMFASDDITFSENCVSKALEILNKQNKDVAGGIFYYKNLCFTEPQWADFGIDFTYGPKLLMNYGLLRLDYFRQFSGFDEAYRFYCADGDLCLKLYEKGKQLIPLPGCFVTHNNVLDVQKKENFKASNTDIELYLKRWLHFVPTHQLPNPRRLMWKQNLLEQSNVRNFKSGSDNKKNHPDTSENIVQELQTRGLLHANQPLRLHLGCGEKHLEGYINIDYPQSEHTVMKLAADFFADIVDLAFLPGTVDEIRLHHVFEHFDRAVAMGLLCKWHQWLKKDGIICIETPDVEVSSHLLLGQDLSYRQIQGVMRHIFGSHEAPWAIHKDGWYEAKFRHVLGSLGFKNINIRRSVWQMTHNITVTAKKVESVDSQVLCATAKKLLRDNMVDESASEEKVWAVWCKKIDELLGAACLGQSQNAGSQQAHGDGKDVTVLIFSKDRAMQLQATIESYNLHCRDNDAANIVVLFKASNLVHKQQYDELKKKFPVVAFVEETDFRKQVLSLIEHCKYVLFLVDDNIFVKPFLLKDITAAIDAEKRAIGFSLRLGKNTGYCYMLNSNQKLPAFECLNGGILKYNWPGAECDFGYPLEVSSSVYRSDEILGLLNQLDYSNPNTLEHGMSKNVRMFVSSAPTLLVFEESVAFCNPVNMVQRVYENNKFGRTHKYAPEQLAEGFSRGMAIDVQKYAGFTPDSAHQEVELYFKGVTTTGVKLRALDGDKISKPKFSVVMANYNNGRYIAQSIESVLGQTFKDWELIIVDDCSTDDSIDMINRFVKDNRIRLICHDTNKGYVASLKTGIAAVKSELFGVLDSDDCLTANAVGTMYQHHVRFPDCGFIYSQFIHCDENLKPKKLGFCRAIPAGTTTLDMQAVSHFKTFKRQDYLKTSGFDESMRYAEDKDIIYKMEEVTQLKFVDDCLYLYRDLPHSQSHDARKAAIGLESVKRAKLAALKRRTVENFKGYYQTETAESRKASAFLSEIGPQKCRPGIAMVSTTDNRGGAAKVAWMLKKGLTASGFQTKMFVKDKFSDDADVIKISNSDFDRAKELERQGLLYYDIKSTLLLAHNRDFTGCDVFHFHNLHGGYFNPFALAGLSRLKPSVWTLHDMQAVTGHCAHSFDCNRWQTGCGNCPNLGTYPAVAIDQTARMWEDKRRIYAESNVEIIVPSKWLKDIVAKSILKDKKVHLIYNGIDEQIYRPYDKSAVRRQLKLPEDAIVIGFASPKGLLEIYKGGDSILEAYKYFVSKYPNLYFLCVGGKAQNAPTERFLQIPYVTDEATLAQIYCAADLFVYPSNADNCPLIVLELMGCGVPIVSFEVGGVPELIEHGKTGVLAPYKNIGELIHLTEQLVLDEAGRRRFGQAAVARLRERFTLNRMIDNHIRLYDGLTQKRLSGQSEQGGEKPVASTGQASKQNQYLVSAIVSTYNSEMFIHSCLEDLESQTIADKLEIIVIDSGSEQNEELIVKEFQKKYGNIVYIKTEREGLYSAWNRAIKAASGQFLTSANTDDRHRRDALEVMANALLKNTDAVLAYGNQIITDTPNPSFENHHVIEMAKRPEFSRQRLLFGCCVGSQPMWRKSLHDEFGGFDETLTCAADWDFWLKIAQKHSFKHIDEFMGLFYRNENGIEHGRKIHSLYERYAVGKRYGNPYISVIKQYNAPDNPLVSIIVTAYNAADYISRAIESILIQSYRNFEIIVVDDGSTDNTADIARGFKNEPIKYFFKENGGVASARNFGLQKSGGSFIIMLDSDDMMTPDYITSHLQGFERHPEADMVYCDDLLIDEQDKPIRVINRPEYSNPDGIISDMFRCGFPVVHFKTCIRRSVFDKLGLYDERLIVAEDYDMMRRFVKQQLKMCHLPAALYLRRLRVDSLSKGFNAVKAKSHFDVIRRFTETFTPEQLFPDVQWGKLPAEQKLLLARCKEALVYLSIGEQYINSKAPDYAEAAFNMACEQLDNCCKIEPANQQVRNLREKCQSIRDKRLSKAGRNIYQQV